MGASAYIGRVGGLAVALGVGAAVATGQGVAWANPPDSDSSNTEQPPPADADATPGAEAEKPVFEPKPEEPPQPPEKPTSPFTSRAGSLLSSLTRAAERGIAISTGGALTSKKTTSQKTAGAAEVEEAEPLKPEETEVIASSEPDPVEKKSSGVLAKKPDEGLFSHLPKAKPIVDVQGVERRVDKVLAAAQPPDTVVQRTAVAVEQTTFETLSAITTTRIAAPVMKAAEAPTEQPALPRLLTNLVSAFGLGAMASDVPGGPVGTPIELLLALGVRRESEESVATLSKTTAVGNSPVAELALTGGADGGGHRTARPCDGLRRQTDRQEPEHRSPHQRHGPGRPEQHVARFGIGGTDLGIMWDNGIQGDNPATTVVEQRQVLIAFGDTFAGYTLSAREAWKINTLLRSSDTDAVQRDVRERCRAG